MTTLVGLFGAGGLGSHLIGGGVFSRFRVVFDYPARTLTLGEPAPPVRPDDDTRCHDSLSIDLSAARFLPGT
jgi:hypothetical protein